mmetsp:Transcript_30506/g.70348  ORF Transcript_30506/g.70348 Transcript_30506/m.70348 type:complete len:96 (+) Transcript_30506:137-424(+)
MQASPGFITRSPRTDEIGAPNVPLRGGKPLSRTAMQEWKHPVREERGMASGWPDLPYLSLSLSAILRLRHHFASLWKMICLNALLIHVPSISWIQ